MSGRLPLALAALAVAAAAQADWQLETGPDPATYQVVAVLAQDAGDTIKDEYATKDVRPTLAFHCTPGGDGSLALRIDWRRFISSFNTEIGFAADDAEPLGLTLGVDRSNKITSARNAADAEALAEYLAGRGSLAVTVTPYSEVPVTVHFDLDGFDAALGELRAACQP